MDSTRRPFGRSLSKGPVLKKPRLNEGPVPPDRPISNGRAGFFQRQTVPNSGAGGGFRGKKNRDSEGGDPMREAYEPQPSHQLHQEMVTQYKAELSELTFNSKPIITKLTIIAGESLQAAKAIAGEICSNIIKVPNDQKLPSLYLLDSIVKNIGKDYIKFFAPILPEVFIEAYRQADPSVHSGMRHLFGTWKGVFPLLSLQMIEKELGFTGSSATTTSRPESRAQGQRPAHSIHVNLKYLEARQRLQTTRARGAASDTGEGLISHEDVEVERTPSVGSGKSWADPYAKHHHQRLRDQVTEPVQEKQPNVPYSDSEYGSILPGRSGFGNVRVTEKVKEPGYGKPQYASSSVIAGRALKKNGFGLKHGFESAHDSVISDPAPHFRQKVTSTNSNGVSGDWKNSEEEEYMWDDMNSRSTNDHLAPDNSDKLDFESHLQRSQIMQDIGSRYDDEALDDSISMAQKLKPPEGRIRSVANKSIPGYSEGYPTGKGSQSTLGKTHTLSQPRQASQNPKSQLLNNFQERSQMSTNLHRDPRRPQGSKTTGPHDQLPEDNYRVQRVQTQNLQSSSSAPIPLVQRKKQAPSAVQPRKNIQHTLPPSQISVGNSSSDQSNPLTNGSPGKSITSSLFDAVGKSGIQPKSASISGGFTKVEKPTEPKSASISGGFTKVEKPTEPSSAANPVSSLLSSLVAKGLISSSSLKSDSVLSASPTKSPNQPPITSSKPLMPLKDDPSSSGLDSPEKIKNLIGFEFRPEVIRNFQPDVISDISSEVPHQCSICGLRLKLQERLDRHMEWHALRAPEDNNENPCRSWFPSLVDWVGRFGPLEILGCSDDEMVGFSDPMVPADESRCACILCGELFEDVYCQERDEWMFKGAVYLTDPSTSDAAFSIPIVHADCLSEDSVRGLGMVCDVKLDVDV